MRRGTTLVEAVVIVAVSVVVLIALVNLFFVFNMIYGYQQAFIATAGSAGISLNALEASVLPAEAVLVSRSFSGTTYTSGATTLVLALPAVDDSGEMLSGVTDYVAFYASSTEFYRLVEAGAGSVRLSGRTKLSSTLFSVSFTYDNADFTQVRNVTADFETRGTFKQALLTSRLHGSWHLRNAPL